MQTLNDLQTIMQTLSLMLTELTDATAKTIFVKANGNLLLTFLYIFSFLFFFSNNNRSMVSQKSKN